MSGQSVKAKVTGLVLEPASAELYVFNSPQCKAEHILEEGTLREARLRISAQRSRGRTDLGHAHFDVEAELAVFVWGHSHQQQVPLYLIALEGKSKTGQLE